VRERVKAKRPTAGAADAAVGLVLLKPGATVCGLEVVRLQFFTAEEARQLATLPVVNRRRESAPGFGARRATGRGAGPAALRRGSAPWRQAKNLTVRHGRGYTPPVYS
jgi:hypothetical protein